MSLSVIQQKILHPFIEETLRNLKTMAAMGGSTEEGFEDDVTKFRFKGYAICAETHGAIDGVMLMHHYIETAVAMGNAVRKHVLGEDEVFEDINEPMADALSEWGNTVIGRATRELGNCQLNIHFEPPYFVFDTDTMSSLLTGVVDVITVPVHVDNVGRFYFNYLIRSVNADFSIEDASPKSDIFDHYIVEGRKASLGLEKDKTILIVDDMKMVRTSIKRYLQKLGYTNIVEADNGKAGVDLFKSASPDFVFMDMVMPEMNGDEALKNMRALSDITPIVMLSSVADKSVVEACQAYGMTGYIVKPLTMETGPDILAKFLQPSSS